MSRRLNNLSMHVSVVSADNIYWPFGLKLWFALFFAGILAALYKAPLAAFYYIGTAFSGLIIVHSCLRLWACLSDKPKPLIPNTATKIYPNYTVLVPLLDEAHMVPSLIEALATLEYPHNKLQILLITEAHGLATTEAVSAFLRPPFESIVVPQGGPKTKPNALNYAMRIARGDIVTIYDAEDHPHPLQLKQAANMLYSDARLGAVQAPLDYYNRSETWLTQQFSLEYAGLFHVWVPFLAKLGLPFPLGGTSNHMRREALTQTGGWDAYNVTEDADLSFRLAALGWKIGYITPPTEEEAVGAWKEWNHQRARWMKGYMQSWLVHMSAPITPKGRSGWLRLLTLQITLGASLLAGFFHSLVIGFLMMAALFAFLNGGTINLPFLMLPTAAISYGAGLFVVWRGAQRAGQKPKLTHIAFTPLYWLILVVPTWLALYDLIKRPYHWRKTTHGLTHQSPELPKSELSVSQV